MQNVLPMSSSALEMLDRSVTSCTFVCVWASNVLISRHHPWWGSWHLHGGLVSVQPLHADHRPRWTLVNNTWSWTQTTCWLCSLLTFLSCMLQQWQQPFVLLYSLDLSISCLMTSMCYGAGSSIVILALAFTILVRLPASVANHSGLIYGPRNS